MSIVSSVHYYFCIIFHEYEYKIYKNPQMLPFSRLRLSKNIQRRTYKTKPHLKCHTTSVRKSLLIPLTSLFISAARLKSRLAQISSLDGFVLLSARPALLSTGHATYSTDLPLTAYSRNSVSSIWVWLKFYNDRNFKN